MNLSMTIAIYGGGPGSGGKGSNCGRKKVKLQVESSNLGFRVEYEESGRKHWAYEIEVK